MQGNNWFEASLAFHITQCTSKQDGLSEKMVWLVGASIREGADSFYISIAFIFSSTHTCDLSCWFGFHGLSWGQQLSCSEARQLQTADLLPAEAAVTP